MEVELEMLVEDAQLAIMCHEYWAVDENGDFTHTVASIARKFGLTSHKATQAIKNACSPYSATLVCIHCGVFYQYESRSDYTRKRHQSEWTCQSCIQDRAETERSRKSHALEQSASSRLQDRFSLDSLDFRQAIYLLTLVRYSIDEDLEYLQSHDSNQTELLAPDTGYGFDIYRELARDNLIIVSPQSNPDYIEITEEPGFNYYLSKVEWLLPVDHKIHSSNGTFIQDLESKLRSLDWDNDWYDQAKVVCREVSLAETVSYLRLVMSEHGFDFVAGDKTVLVLKKVLEKYSVAQAYNLVWAAGKDAAAYYMRGGIPKKQAANSVVGGIERRFERALANNWDTKPFNRNFNLPMSVLSQVLYNTTLQTDDGGFHKATHEII